MKRISISSIVLVTIFVIYLKPINGQTNPCPDVFEYKVKEGKKYGIIRIPEDQNQNSTVLKATIAIHDEINYDDTGLLDFIKSFDKTRNDARHGKDILYKLVFPESKQWAIIKEITLNNKIICKGPEVSNMNMWHYSKEFNYPNHPTLLENEPTTPCPNIFEYKTHQRVKYGLIAIHGRRTGETILKASIGIYEDFNTSDTGSLEFYRSYETTLSDARKGKRVLYKLRFPKFEFWPEIEKITLNNETICTGHNESDLKQWNYEKKFTYPTSDEEFPEQPSLKTTSTPAFKPFNIPPTAYSTPISSVPVVDTPNPTTGKPNSTTEKPNPPVSMNPPTTGGTAKPDDSTWLQTFSMQSTCGKRQDFVSSATSAATALVIGGTPVEVGEYPWMVAMFTFERRKSVFFCGGNLISDTHVITAAHCVRNKARVLLEFGKHDLSRNDEQGFVVRISSGIVEHPEYVDKAAHADIAIVFFEPVTFTYRIRPICIWQFGTTFDFLRRRGTITGWGQEEQGGDFSDLPNQLQIEKTDIDRCRNSHVLLRSLATDKTFCAGGNFTGPCQGDSGSGFYITHGNTWYLRGIISTSVGNLVACHVDKYAVYVDIIYYLEWIKNTIT